MNFIHYNPFRILGLPVDASERDITKRIYDLETAIEFGKTVSYETDFTSLSKVIRTADTIRDAANRIETEEDRFNYSLFWFSKSNVCDDLALDVLKNGDVNKAINLFEGQLTSGIKNDSLYSNAKNLAILYMAIARQNGSYNGELLSKGMTWCEKILDAKYLSSYVKQFSGKRIHANKEKVLNFYIEEVIKSVTPYLDKPKSISLNDFLLKFSSYPEPVRKQIAARFTATHINHIQTCIDKAIQERKRSAHNADMIGDNLYKDTRVALKKINEILSSNDLQYQIIADKLADEIYNCSINYYNYHLNNETDIDPGDKTLRLVRIANSIAIGHNIKQRISEGIPIIENWVNGQSERCLRNKIKNDYEVVVENLNSVPDPDVLTEQQVGRLLYLADNLIKNCKAHLDTIRDVVGPSDETYISLSNAVANNAIGMCIHYANEKGNFGRVIEIFARIGSLYMTPDTRRQYEDNLNFLKKQVNIRHHMDFIIEALNNVPDPNTSNIEEIKKLPNIAQSLVMTTKPRLAAIKCEDYDLYIKLSSAIASNALGMCIEYANRTHDMSSVINVMGLIGDLDMDMELRQRYKNNYSILVKNISASRNTTSSGCFIATMVYGDYNAPEVLILRRYRDYVLSKIWVGRTFIKIYYRISPSLVKRYSKNDKLKSLLKCVLNSLIRRLT